ncbi:MAG: GAF domain-containing protein [Acidimicrobiales bacterium]
MSAGPHLAIVEAVLNPGRLAVVDAWSLGEVVGDVDLDAIAKRAARLCQTPVGLVTVLDSNRQWNVGRHGTTLDAVPVGLSLCAHVVAEGAMVVGDLRFDERFAEHPLVVAEDGLRFYAGAPVSVDGEIVGAVAVADLRPRTLGPNGRPKLIALAQEASAVLSLRMLGAASRPA